MRSKIVLALVGLVALLATACGSEKTSTSAAVSLSGAGATFPAPLYLQWITAYKTTNPNVSINYQPIGSGGGVEQFIKQTVDFAGSDAFMKDDEIAAAAKARGCGVLHIPTVFGAVAVAFNVTGLKNLTLDGPTLAKIFLGTVKRYDDPAIKALNPGATLPSTPIVLVHRADASGTTSIFTKYLASVSPAWLAKVGPGKKDAQFPIGVGGQGNDGVSAAISQNPGGLGYVELSYALTKKLVTAQLKNKDGKAVAPTLASTQAASQNVTIPSDLRFNVLGIGGDGYPIVGATWILAYECKYDKAKADALKSFLTWAIKSGDSIATGLNYVPVSGSLETQSLANVDKINSKS